MILFQAKFLLQEKIYCKLRPTILLHRHILDVDGLTIKSAVFWQKDLNKYYV